MKDRTEFKQVLGSGICDLRYDSSGRMIFATCNAVTTVAVNAENVDDTIGTFQSDKSGFSCIAVHPTKQEVAFGGDDCTVVRFSSVPKSKFDHQGYITSAQSAIRSIAYSSTGAYMFVGTEYVSLSVAPFMAPFLPSVFVLMVYCRIANLTSK